MAPTSCQTMQYTITGSQVSIKYYFIKLLIALAGEPKLRSRYLRCSIEPHFPPRQDGSFRLQDMDSYVIFGI